VRFRLFPKADRHRSGPSAEPSIIEAHYNLGCGDDKGEGVAEAAVAAMKWLRKFAGFRD
jgi:hypothetical protein